MPQGPAAGPGAREGKGGEGVGGVEGAQAAGAAGGGWEGSGAMVSAVDLQPGLHLHACGHAMHYSCFQSYW